MADKSEKIFIDLDEEINFVIEKVRSSDADKIVLIIPKNSNMTGSLISLKVLAKQLTKLKKLVVISTEDHLGQRLAEKSSLVAVDTPGDIDEETWAQSHNLIEEYKEELERRKRMLLERRDESKGDDYKIVEESKPEEHHEEMVEEPVEEEDSDEVKPIRPVTRVPAKVTTVGTVKFYSAGDVLDNEELLSELIPREETKEEDIDDDESDDIDGEDIGEDEGSVDVDDENKDTAVSRFRRRNLIGMDYASMAPQKIPRGQMPKAKKADGPNPISSMVESFKNTIDSYLDTPKKKKYAVAAAVAVMLFLLITPVFGASATVDITLKKDDLAISETIIANPQVQGINVATFEIPAETRSLEDSASESGSATGTGVAGEKAEGVLTIYNLTDNPKTIPSGTKVTLVQSGLNYFTTSDVTAMPVSDMGPNDDFPEVGIVASEAGDAYNTTGQKDFTFDGYPSTQVKGKNFSAVQGGESEEITVVSQDDIDSLKEIVRKRIESTAVGKLESLAAAEEIILEETIQVNIVDENSSKAVGEEADRFDVSMTAEVSAIFVKKSDVEEMAREIARLNQEIEGESEINIAVFPDITNVEFADGVATFQITSNASAKANLSEEGIKDELEGMSLSDAEEFLDDQSDIEDYDIEFSPSFLPGFMKNIPSGDSFEVNITK